MLNPGEVATTGQIMLPLCATKHFSRLFNYLFSRVLPKRASGLLLLLGLSALIVPLVVAQQLIRLDVPIMIGVSLLLYGLALDGYIGRWDGLLLFSGILVYTTFAVIKGRRSHACRSSLPGFASPGGRVRYFSDITSPI